jgi:hypothetical protein
MSYRGRLELERRRTGGGVVDLEPFGGQAVDDDTAIERSSSTSRIFTAFILTLPRVALLGPSLEVVTIWTNLGCREGLPWAQSFVRWRSS